MNKTVYLIQWGLSILDMKYISKILNFIFMNHIYKFYEQICLAKIPKLKLQKLIK